MSSTDQMKNLKMIMEGKKSNHQSILEDIDLPEYRNIYLEWYNYGTVLTESKLTQDQIQQIFSAVAAGARDGLNADSPDAPETPAGTIPKRGILGSMSNSWLKFKEKIAQSDRVSGFDVRFDKLQQKVLKAAGGKSGAVGKALNAYKQFATKYPKMQGAIYAALAILAGMSGWGIAGPALMLGIRTIDRLLQGDRFSSALWKGFKAGALSYGAGEVADFVKPTPPPVDTSGYPMWADPYHSGDVVSTGGSQYTAQPGDNLSKIAQKFNVSVPELLKANPDIYNPSNPNDLAAGAKLNIPSATGSPVYQGGVGTAADTAAKVASGQYTPSRYGIKESILDVGRMSRTWQLQESMKLPQRSKPYITNYGISKIFESVSTAYVNEETYDDYVTKTKETKQFRDKLDLFWRRNYREYSDAESVDSSMVIDFLRRMGVKDPLITKVFSDLKIPPSEVKPTDVPPSEVKPTDVPPPKDTAPVEEPPKEEPPKEAPPAETPKAMSPIDFSELLKKTYSDYRAHLEKLFTDYKSAGGEFAPIVTKTMDEIFYQAKLGMPMIPGNTTNRMESKQKRVGAKKV